MGRRSDYKKQDGIADWDMNKGCRHKMAVARYIANNQWVLPAFFPTVTHWATLPEAPKEVDDERSNGNA